MVCAYQIFNIFDILSVTPEIKVNGNSRFVTKFGILTSFLCIFVIIIFIFFTFIDVLSRSKFSVVYNLDNREIPILSFYQSQIAILLTDPFGKEIEEFDRYFTFAAKYAKINIPTNYTSETSEEYINNMKPTGEILDIPIKSCKNMVFNKFSNFFMTFANSYKSGLCADLSNFKENLFGKYGSLKGYSMLGILFLKCSNSTLINKTNCYSEEIIKKKLSNVYVNLITIENDIDSNNFENPILEYYKNDIIPISSSIYKTYVKELNSVKYTSDNGLIFNQKLNYQSYRTDTTLQSVDLRDNTAFPGMLSQIMFRCSGKTEIYIRTYEKIPAIFAQIGGILQAIIISGRCLVYIFSKNSLISYLIIHLFESEDIKYHIGINLEKIKILKVFSNNKIITNMKNNINIKNKSYLSSNNNINNFESSLNLDFMNKFDYFKRNNQGNKIENKDNNILNINKFDNNDQLDQLENDKIIMKNSINKLNENENSIDKLNNNLNESNLKDKEPFNKINKNTNQVKRDFIYHENKENLNNFKNQINKNLHSFVNKCKFQNSINYDKNKSSAYNLEKILKNE